jgi:DNA-binding LacI/PurR family transcriptional regulator
MGEAAIGQLLERIAAPLAPVRTVMFAPTVVRRGSTAVPPAR